GTACGPVPERVERVAYCTGSGSSLWREALASGAQLFITGDVKYHTALETRIAILDVGHHSLEEEMMRRMGLLVAAMFDGLEVIFVTSASPLRPRGAEAGAGLVREEERQ
ncbi:MAG: Nif3-like dinuclear metal center hexameric protein, partial [Desulfovibrio sp.]|nr:Nif3-like dinuclear metal center hexameric protein [Desulfovibrio sp.]